MEPVAVAVIVDEHTNAKHVVFGADQPQYFPLPALVFEDGTVVTEWKLSEEERARVSRGENIRLWVMTFNRPIQPVRLEITEE